MVLKRRNIKILAENVHDTAELTATSAALPVDNTQRSERSRVWRSVGDDQQTIDATLDKTGWIDTFAIVRHKMAELDYIRLTFYLGGEVVYGTEWLAMAMFIPAGIWRAGIDAYGATYNELLPSGSQVYVKFFDAPLAIDSYKIEIKGAPKDGYFEIGRVFVGYSFSPQENYNWGAVVEWGESGEHVPTEAGSLRTIGGTSERRRRFDIELDWLSAADRTNLVTKLVKVGMGGDLLVAMQPDGDGFEQLEHTMVCRREQALSHAHGYPRAWQSKLGFIEV